MWTVVDPIKVALWFLQEDKKHAHILPSMINQELILQYLSIYTVLVNIHSTSQYTCKCTATTLQTLPFANSTEPVWCNHIQSENIP